MRLLLALGWIFMAGATAAQQTSPLPEQELLRMQMLGGAAPMDLSPDGRWLAYTVVTRKNSKPPEPDEYFRTGVPWFGFGCDIYLLDTETRATRNLTTGTGSNWLPTWSPDGRWLAFLSDRGESRQAELWVWQSDKNEIRRVTDLKVRIQGWDRIEWTADSSRVLLATVPGGLSIPDYLKRVTSGDEKQLGAGALEPSEPSVTLYSSVGSISKTTPPGPLSLNWTVRDLAIVEISTGKTSLAAHGSEISAYHMCRSGTCIAYSTPQGFEQAGSQQIVFALRVVDLAGHTVRDVASNTRLNLSGAFSISPDGRLLSFRTGGQKERSFDVYAADAVGKSARNLTQFKDELPDESYRTGQWRHSPVPLWDSAGEVVYFTRRGGLWRASIVTGEAAEVARIAGREIEQVLSEAGSSVWSYDRGKSVVVLAHDDRTKQEGFYAVDLTTGRSIQLFERGECYSCENPAESKLAAPAAMRAHFAYIAQDAQHAPDIWIGRTTPGPPRRLTNLNPQLDKYQMGASRLVEWLSDDGKRLRGGLILPSDYEAGKRYPMIVVVYGGLPISDSVNKFGGFDAAFPYYNVQLLATRGYAVLMPDAPQHLGTPMLDLAKAVLPGVNKVVELGIADPDRLGVMGHSYGGYSVLALIVQTKRFKAAIDFSGFGDVLGLYGEMDKNGAAFGTSAESGQVLMGGNPWMFRERYIENSPLLYLDRVETPLLVVHGDQDAAVAAFLGDEIFVGLRRLGKVVEYAKYSGEGHDLIGYANQADFVEREIRWLDTYLKGGPQ